ncbi:MAG: DNA replication/repair protein RecF [Candidatus Krumholzibacteriia bacterium]
MRIDRFSSTQLRNLDDASIVFSSGVNILVGQNGHGKTNILEAIHFLKFGRSFRTTRDADLIGFEHPLCRFEITSVYRDDTRETFAVSLERGGGKHIKVDGKPVEKLSDLVGRYPCVLFGPQDLVLVSGFPAERRKFMDMVGSMTDRGYLEELKGYRRVLAQRNAALRSGDFASAFGVWTGDLLKRGCALVERRAELLRALDEHLQTNIRGLSVPWAVRMKYESALIEGRPEQVTGEQHFAALLAGAESEETRRRTTLVGPHRDDVRLDAGGKDLRRYGSQGQRRLVAILLRLTELSYLETVLKEPCVLLLDDVFSELDPAASGALKEKLHGTHQIFVTSPVEVEWEGIAQRFRVSRGTVESNAGG